MAEPKKHVMQRRDFLRAASGGALAVTAGGLMSNLAGCGGGGGSSIASGFGGASSGTRSLVATQSVAGTVNTGQIGGANLQVVSAHQANSSADAKGAFTTTVSAEGAQLLSVKDGSGRLRALGVSLPNSGALSLDATSTALALVLLTPGILAVEPAEAARRSAQIKGLTAFGPLLAFLTAQLNSSSFDELKGNATLESLKTAAITEWMDKFKPLIVPAALGGRNVTPNTIKSHFTASWVDPSGKNTAPDVNLSNSGSRFVRVDLIGVDTSGKRVTSQIPAIGPAPLSPGKGYTGPSTPLAAMGGVTAPSWGSLFVTSSQGATTTTNHVTLTTPPGLVALDYYISGIGHQAGSDVPPYALPNLREDELKTIIYYLLFPFIDFVTGAVSGIGSLFKILHIGAVSQESFEFLDKIYAKIPPTVSLSSFQLNVEYGQTAQAAAALLDVCAAIISIVVLAVASALSTVAATLLGAVLTGFGIGFSLGTLYPAIRSWESYPATAKLELPVSTLGVTVR